MNSIFVGINGIGRIGKCVLLQILEQQQPIFSIRAINVTKLAAKDIEDYLNFDSVHGRRKIQVSLLENNQIQINNHVISLVAERDPSKINWQKMGVEYLIDCTGAFLTEEKCKSHNAPFTIISSPPKDKMPTFIYGVNDTEYKGQKIISGSSCTTNCLAPMLALLDKAFGVEEAVFTTIHAATASQYVTDVIQKGARTDRSIFNNIIPHTTGASSSVTAVLPNLEGKIFGTSVRVPVSNCSLVDLNVKLKNKKISLETVKLCIQNNNQSVFSISERNRVSGDYMTTTCPTNLDLNASIEMPNGQFKFFLWYDNEWSYSAQLLRMVEVMVTKNKEMQLESEKQSKLFSHFVENLELREKGVVCRFDYNVPVNDKGEITDDFRMTSTLETMKAISRKGAQYIVIATHFGRPKGKEMKYSTEFMVPRLQEIFQESVTFLPHGVSALSVQKIQEHPHGIFLLENIRFHEEETLYEKAPEKCSDFAILYSLLGDVFVSDAFGCAHRKHFSVHGISTFANKTYGYGYLIKREMDSLTSLVDAENKSILGIIGGNKIKDKLPVIDTLKKVNNCKVFVAGGLARQYEEQLEDTNVFVMSDGIGTMDLREMPEYIDDISNSLIPVYDIGSYSLTQLEKLACNADVIFWNGSLGLIEDHRFRQGSDTLKRMLLSPAFNKKTIIIGGGETASLFEKDQLQNIYVSTGGGALLEFVENRVLHKKSLVGLEIFE
jgi:glyceraldehyde 3-phosphate dehydrogenase